MQDLIYESLEKVSETAGDISPEIYENYFGRCPGSAALMSHIDGIVRGRMLDEVFRLLMIPEYGDEQSYLNFEVKNHKTAYMVESNMYGNLLDAVVDTIRTKLGDEWTDGYAQAWDLQVSKLLEEIDKRLK